MDEHTRRLIDAQSAAATTFTEIFVDELLGEAQRLAPIEEGTLRASAGRTTERHAGGGVTVTGYFATPYAAVQHERTDYRHPRGGQAKYLEEPLKRRAHEYPAGIARVCAAVARRMQP